MKTCFLSLIVAFCITNISAKQFNSGKLKVSLIELYTSQSCSSCPPAESWLTSLKSSKNLWKRFIPVSYHVSYWNHLHWKDTFSKEQFSRRQRDYHRVIKGGVYTPQIVLNGKDKKSWRNIRKAMGLFNEKIPGNLSVNIDKEYKNAEVIFKSQGHHKDLVCYGAYLESGHPIKVTSGENRGKVIEQDFIVIDLFQKEALKKNNHYSCHLNIKINQTKNAKEKSMAFWLINKKTYQVVQATGGNIP